MPLDLKGLGRAASRYRPAWKRSRRSAAIEPMQPGMKQGASAARRQRSGRHLDRHQRPGPDQGRAQRHRAVPRRAAADRHRADERLYAVEPERAVAAAGRCGRPAVRGPEPQRRRGKPARLSRLQRQAARRARAVLAARRECASVRRRRAAQPDAHQPGGLRAQRHAGGAVPRRAGLR